MEKVQFDGEWLVSSDTTVNLQKAGYMVGTFIDGGVRKYTLHNRELAYGPEKMRWPTVFETSDLEELNNVVKLLIGG